MPGLVVHKFTRDEWPLYRTLRLAALEESPDAFGSTLAEERVRNDDEWERRLARGLSSTRDLPLLARINNEPAGLAWARLDRDGFDSAAHLYQMWVTPPKRRMGVGRALLDAAIEWARNVRAPVILLNVTAGNTAALGLYEAAGFRATGIEQPLRPGSDRRSQTMRLALDVVDSYQAAIIEHRLSNIEGWKHLQRAGYDGTTAIRLGFMAEAPSKWQAESFKQSLKEQDAGCKVSISRGFAARVWCITAETTPMILSPDRLDSWTDLMLHIAFSNQCHFDGWFSRSSDPDRWT